MNAYNTELSTFITRNNPTQLIRKRMYSNEFKSRKQNVIQVMWNANALWCHLVKITVPLKAPRSDSLDL